MVRWEQKKAGERKQQSSTIDQVDRVLGQCEVMLERMHHIHETTVDCLHQQLNHHWPKLRAHQHALLSTKGSRVSLTSPRRDTQKRMQQPSRTISSESARSAKLQPPRRPMPPPIRTEMSNTTSVHQVASTAATSMPSMGTDSNDHDGTNFKLEL